MPDAIGRITVPTLVDSGLTFSLTSDMGYGFTQDRPVVTHRLGELDAKAEQRFAVGLGPRKFAFRRQRLSMRDRGSLVSFWEGLQGAWKSFTYNVPNTDQTTSATKVTWEYAPLSIQYLANACQVGFNFIEVPDPSAAPTYPVSSTCLRFPSTALQTALLSQVQQIIPLVHVRVRESAVPDIYLSDRRCTVGGQLYLPRVLGLGEPGSDVIMSQDIKGTADNVQFTFGNADRVMTALANNTDLKYAQIDLSLYHVNSGILLQLWSGFIVAFVSDGSAQFTVRASDGLYQITQMYPTRAISRQCWKTYNDGAACPWASRGASSSAVTAAGGDPTSCDYYFDSANGCRMHGMQQYFGGHPATPQGVSIKDNSTGLWGFGRSTVTATSIISDSVWGNALQEIWCNDDGDPGKAFWVNCMIIDGRDESDFYDALGIVSAGPIGAYTGMLVYQNADGYRYIVAPLLDGQPPQGFKVDGSLNVVTNNPTLGLRESYGTDPTDQSAIDDRLLLSAGGAIVGDQRAAGTAFVEIRRPDQPGIQPTTTDQHQMQVPISQGLTGWTWDQNGNRTAVAGLTNPFWIAVNSLLRALGLSGSTSAAQLGKFVLASLFVGDGSGAAEIADGLVRPIIGPGTNGVVDSVVLDSGGSGYTTASVSFSSGGGSGAAAEVTIVDGVVTDIQLMSGGSGYTTAPVVQITGDGYGASASATISTSALYEKQFRFQGVLAQQKPFRDWLTEILACGLGYFTWEFGKLKLGCRINASATDAFTLGNMLFQSLRLEPIEASFEHLVIDFADQAYQYQANTAEYQDKTHAAYYGRAGAPLTARQHLVGCGTLSQALRLAAVRTREEIGGVNAAEWLAARNASWKTTILALGTEVGQVVSLTHPDVPGGYGDFRIQSWRLNKDWSIDITAKTVTPSMYDLTVGPKPADVVPEPLPASLPLTGDIAAPPAPTFGVEVSDLDSTVAEVAGLAFSTSVNTHSISGAKFGFFYVDPSASIAHLTSAMGSGDQSIQLDSVANAQFGNFIQIGNEILQCGTPNGNTVAVLRGCCGTTAAAAANGASVATVTLTCATASFSGDFFNTDPNAPQWSIEKALPNMDLLAVGAYVTNSFGQSPVTYVPLINGSGQGLLLVAASSNATVVDVTNQDVDIPDGNVLVNLTATTRNCTLTLPQESGDQGNQVTVKLSAGSTYNGIVAPHSGDTIDSSGASITITPSAPVWAGVGN